ncbi:hypothetical protein BAUCODRAFT_80706 [Baudoinia panamericana UAMH 10762]|uniref:Heme haloperoxidase family profile domain-containing protein n=1 Tax=Baudoinia panamericana (strain UAMH 10762) TaxID=717646 RepID=M2MX91_BAUPA|nr:uncharacterized protein BAUCODRAFT_80706 [Baudoinia panamericana UAMH 10762]EMC90870.1 hypothetical protein BAUCODRAFT_80706 [Baudoinia panamericana UAMH 10762]
MKRQSSSPQGSGVGLLPLVPPPFDASAQLIDVSGKHAFTPPSASDARGQCPGLNALANHNYLPHNGVATIAQFVDATTKVFGMGVDLATFLSTYGAVLDGNGLSWSIKGGEHVGIGGSHGNYETDSSPLKSDLFQYGTNQKLVMSQFNKLYGMQPDASTANYNLDVLRTFRNDRFTESIEKNPLFVYGPFEGMAVSQAAFTFIYRFMANHSAEYPEGVLNKDVLKSFMSISGPENNLVWTPGYEQIPANWYRRSELDAYTIPYFETDILYFTESNPQLSLVGCNEGTVNSYQNIDAGTLSNGAYSAQDAAANPLCFALEFAQLELPGLTGLASTLLSPLLSALNSATSALKCKPIVSVNNSPLALCPGYSLYGGPTAPVAPGAIQS